jgi:hypothetical protein
MPLLFNSLSHGEIPFGFFNIETDMVLLNNYFFFASDMCRQVAEIAGRPPGEPSRTEWGVYILDEGRIGNLMGCIAGVELSGFLGEIYSLFPFPHEPERFKQNPDGYMTRERVEGIVKRYAELSAIGVIFDGAAKRVSIGQYLFSREGFHNLLNYLWAGGYPKWKGGIRPDYVLAMKEAVEASPHPLFGFRFPA